MWHKASRQERYVPPSNWKKQEKTSGVEGGKTEICGPDPGPRDGTLLNPTAQGMSVGARIMNQQLGIKEKTKKGKSLNNLDREGVKRGKFS